MESVYIELKIVERMSCLKPISHFGIRHWATDLHCSAAQPKSLATIHNSIVSNELE